MTSRHVILPLIAAAALATIDRTPASANDDAWAKLRGRSFYDLGTFSGAAGIEVRFGAGTKSPTARRIVHGSGVPVISDETREVRVDGDAISLVDLRVVYDARCDILLDPTSVGRRLVPVGASGWTGTAASRVVEAFGRDRVREALSDKDPIVRREALFYLGYEQQYAKSPSLPEAAKMLDDPDAEVRAYAAWAAGRCRVKEAVEPLIARLSDDSAPVRREAARALGWGRLGGERAIAPLEALQKKDEDTLVREAAEEALERLGR